MGIAEELKHFIFEHINSAEQIEVLLLLRAHRDRDWTAKQVSDELRTNPESVARRLEDLRTRGFLSASGSDPATYRFAPGTPFAERLIGDLAEAYRVRRSRVYELIFSPLRKIYNFSDAFRLKKEEDDG